MGCGLRVFSYLPNPRVWKATIAGRLCGVEVEIRGAPPGELATWLWDFDARALSAAELAAATDSQVGRTGFGGVHLRKTADFLRVHPFGNVPAAFSPAGDIGIFESNSIMRAVARLGAAGSALYGSDPYQSSRIDSFLDVSLVFARDSQVYLLSLMNDTLSAETHARTREALLVYLAGISRALAPDRAFLVGDDLTLADICFAVELCLFENEHGRTAVLTRHGLQPIVQADVLAEYPLAFAHFEKLCGHSAFAPDVAPYRAKLGRGNAASI